MIETRQAGTVLEVRERMPVGERLLVGCLALLPLIVPWELLVRLDWPAGFSWPFLFAVLFSLVAVAVTGLLATVAFAGLDTRLVVDRASGRVRSVEWAPLRWRRVRELDAAAVAAVAVETRDARDGAPTWGLVIRVRDQSPLRLVSSCVRVEIEELAQRLADHLLVPLADAEAAPA